jgi:hypothetical protein
LQTLLALQQTPFGLTLNRMERRVLPAASLALGAFVLGWTLRGSANDELFLPIVLIGTFAVIAGWLASWWRSRSRTPD